MAPPLTAPTTDTAACRTFSDDPYVPGEIITHVTLVGDMDAGVSVAFDSTSIGLFVEDKGRLGREGRVTFNTVLSDPNAPDAAPAHAPEAQAIPATSTGALALLAVLLLLVARRRIRRQPPLR